MKIIFILLLLSKVSIAHRGRTNSEGCHNNRKTGGYHCHNSRTYNSVSEEKKSNFQAYNQRATKLLQIAKNMYNLRQQDNISACMPLMRKYKSIAEQLNEEVSKDVAIERIKFKVAVHELSMSMICLKGIADDRYLSANKELKKIN